MTTDQIWLQQATDLAIGNVNQGGGPFGAVIVQAGRLVATGQNRVTRDLDPTAHAEVQAIRSACRALGEFSLAGCVLYTSCEPCPLCLTASFWARLDKVLYAADRHDAARGGFDDREFYDVLGREPSTWPTQVVRGANTAPFARSLRGSPSRTGPTTETRRLRSELGVRADLEQRSLGIMVRARDDRPEVAK